MKYFLSLLLLAALTACNSNTNSDKPQTSKPSTDVEKYSYFIGFSTGANLRFDSLQVSNEYLVQGYLDAMSGDSIGAKALLNEEEREQAQKLLDSVISTQHKKRIEAEYGDVKADGEKFLAENKKKPGVITLPSGLQYKILKKGAGAKPGKHSQVLMHILAKFINGQIFDNTNDREPVVLPVDQLIPGWQEIVPMMPVGSKWEVVIPQELAYGEKGAGGVIPPYATLIFEMELLDIKK